MTGRVVERLALNVSETAEALGVSRDTVYALLGDGRLRSVRAGRVRLIPVASVEHLLAGPENDESRVITPGTVTASTCSSATTRTDTEAVTP